MLGKRALGRMREELRPRGAALDRYLDRAGGTEEFRDDLTALEGAIRADDYALTRREVSVPTTMRPPAARRAAISCRAVHLSSLPPV
jgi:hypothetical protein